RCRPCEPRRSGIGPPLRRRRASNGSRPVLRPPRTCHGPGWACVPSACILRDLTPDPIRSLNHDTRTCVPVRVEHPTISLGDEVILAASNPNDDRSLVVLFGRQSESASQRKYIRYAQSSRLAQEASESGKVTLIHVVVAHAQ